MSDPQPGGGQPIGDVAKDVVNKDSSNCQGRPGKTSSVSSALKKPVTLVAFGVVGAAAIGVGVTVATSGGSGSTSTTATTSPPATSVPAGAGSATTAPPTEAPPTLTAISAVFTQSAYSTVYTENATPGASGQALTYKWSVAMSADSDCGSGFRGSTPTPNQATWFHADKNPAPGEPTGPCDHHFYGATGHPGVVSVTVSSSHWSCTATYVGTMTGPGNAPQPCTKT